MFFSRFSRMIASIKLFVFSEISLFLISKDRRMEFRSSASTIFKPKSSPSLLIDKLKVRKVLLLLRTWITASSIVWSKEHDDKFKAVSPTTSASAKMWFAPSARIGFSFRSIESIFRRRRMFVKTIAPSDAKI